MNSTITSKLIRWLFLSGLAGVTGMPASFAQKSTALVNSILKQQAFYAALPKTYYIAVLPIQGCFSCVAVLHNQVKDIVPGNKIVMVYPTARKIEQEKIVRGNKIDNGKAFYVFNDSLYQKLYDNKAPKGYILKVQK